MRPDRDGSEPGRSVERSRWAGSLTACRPLWPGFRSGSPSGPRLTREFPPQIPDGSQRGSPSGQNGSCNSPFVGEDRSGLRHSGLRMPAGDRRSAVWCAELRSGLTLTASTRREPRRGWLKPGQFEVAGDYSSGLAAYTLLAWRDGQRRVMRAAARPTLHIRSPVLDRLICS